jgi:hypothetical protein
VIKRAARRRRWDRLPDRTGAVAPHASGSGGSLVKDLESGIPNASGRTATRSPLPALMHQLITAEVISPQ